MSYKVSTKVKEETIQLMQEQLNNKNSKAIYKSSKKLTIVSFSLAMVVVFTISNTQQTQMLQLTTTNSDFVFNSENQTGEIIDILLEDTAEDTAIDYNSYIKTINLCNPSYNTEFILEPELEEFREDFEQLHLSSIVREYERIMEYQKLLSFDKLTIEQHNEIQNTLNQMTLTNPLKEWNYISQPYIFEEFDYCGVKILHRAYDIAVDLGTPIYTIADGIVVTAKYQGKYGNLVIIDHQNGLQTYYAHCSEILVTQGQEVTSGDIIAKVGQTGLATGPHLHFEVRYNELEPIDLMEFDFDDETLFNFE